jgi:hypothetical protein
LLRLWLFFEKRRNIRNAAVMIYPLLDISRYISMKMNFKPKRLLAKHPIAWEMGRPNHISQSMDIIIEIN